MEPAHSQDRPFAQGVLQIRVSSEADFSQYEPFIVNTASLIALQLENLDNVARLESLNRNLEIQIAQRSASLIESEERFRVLSESVPQLVWTCQPDGFCDYLNARWLDYTGVAAAALYGDGWWEQVHPDDRSNARLAWQRAVARIEPFDVEMRIRAADGSYRWFKSRAAALRGAEGGMLTWFGTHTDIEDLRRVQEALRITSGQRQLALEAGGLGTWDYRFETGEVFWDERARDMYGFSSGARIGYSEAIANIHAEDRPGVEQAVRRALAGETGGVYHCDYRVVWPDGSVRWVYSHGRVYFERTETAARPVRFIGVNLDISDRKAAEDALRQSQVRLHLALDAANSGVWEWDVHSNRNTWSDELWKVYRLEPGSCEPSYEAWLQVVHSDDRAAVERTVREAARNGTPLNVEWRIDGKDGAERWLMSRGQPLRDAAGQVDRYLGIVVDITERKAAEHALEHSREALARLNTELEKRVQERTAALEAANQELEAFGYSISHDLRAPLRAVDGFSAALAEDFGPQLPSEAQRFVGLVRRGAQQMGTLIDDLLSFSRLSRVPLNKRRVNTNLLVSAAIEQLGQHIGERSIDFQIEELPECPGDPHLLQQVWVNLLSNAIKYTRRRPDARIQVGSVRGEGEDVYFVRDNGTGFDMRYADKLFGVFQRLHRAEEFEGTGVGLAIVQRIVRRHGGRVWAEAEVGRGATFWFTVEKTDAAGC